MGGRSRKTLPSSTFTGKVNSFMFSSSMWSMHSPLSNWWGQESGARRDHGQEKQADRQTSRQTGREAIGQGDRQAIRMQKVRGADRQIARQPDSQKVKKGKGRHTYRQVGRRAQGTLDDKTRQ